MTRPDRVTAADPSDAGAQQRVRDARRRLVRRIRRTAGYLVRAMPRPGRGHPRPAEAPDGAAPGARLARLQERLSGSDRPLRVALIADTDLAATIPAGWEVVAIRPEDWRTTLEARPPDLLLVGTAWWGNEGAWQYRLAWYPHPDAIGLRDLRSLAAWCAARDIPSVLWSTVAPGQAARFEAAGGCLDGVVAGSAGGLEHLAQHLAAVVGPA